MCHTLARISIRSGEETASVAAMIWAQQAGGLRGMLSILPVVGAFYASQLLAMVTGWSGLRDCVAFLG
jgi:hypothetical protein